MSFSAPQRFISGEHWVAECVRDGAALDANFWAFLDRLHQASGMGAGWILLADAIAASFILLALTGVVLWTRLHGPRLLAATARPRLPAARDPGSPGSRCRTRRLTVGPCPGRRDR